MAETTIEWADFSFNPWEGCQKVAPECDNCYAEARDHRFTGGAHWGPRAPRRRTSAANWHKPHKWNRDHAAFHAAHGRRQRVFCASLADVFDNAVDPKWRADLFDLIRATPNLDFLLLTKRPQNMTGMLPEDWRDGWPHVWLGTTAGTQKTADQNVPHLLATPAAVRFVSAEPLLGPVEFQVPWSKISPNITVQTNALLGLTGMGGEIAKLDWIIVGGESGPHARPMHPDWARALRDQCQAAGVAFFFKQWGEWLPFGQSGFTAWRGHTTVKGGLRKPKGKWWGHADFNDGAGGRNTHTLGPVETRMLDTHGTQAVRVGKRAAGRLLDGREWNEVPHA